MFGMASSTGLKEKKPEGHWFGLLQTEGDKGLRECGGHENK